MYDYCGQALLGYICEKVEKSPFHYNEGLH